MKEILEKKIVEKRKEKIVKKIYRLKNNGKNIQIGEKNVDIV